jgi:hypothetical protein
MDAQQRGNMTRVSLCKRGATPSGDKPPDLLGNIAFRGAVRSHKRVRRPVDSYIHVPFPLFPWLAARTLKNCFLAAADKFVGTEDGGALFVTF